MKDDKIGRIFDDCKGSVLSLLIHAKDYQELTETTKTIVLLASINNELSELDKLALNHKIIDTVNHVINKKW